MYAYVYQADIYCEKCGEEIRATLDLQGKAPADPADESSYDSGEYPKGPYSGGGGEADTPQSCGNCGAFLENALTTDGVDYLLAIDDSHGFCTAEWLEFYGFHERAELFGAYDIRHGVIQSPGKFEAEYLWAPYIYGLMMDGAADETLYEGEQPIDVFKAPFSAEFPELAEVEYVTCWEDNSGFLYVQACTAAEVEALRERLDELASAEEDEEADNE